MGLAAGWRGGRLKIENEPGRPNVASWQPAHPAVGGSDSDPQTELLPGREAVIDEAIVLFSYRYGRTIGREEAGRMLDRLTAFFEILIEWDRPLHHDIEQADAA